MNIYRFSFPFGRPDGALKATLSLLERVLAKDLATPISRDDIRHFIGKCLENAAYINYTRVSDQAKIEGKKENIQGERGGRRETLNENEI